MDAIGYISLGSLNDTVKALQIDGADATVANIKSGSYTIARPFNIATQATISEQAQAFIDFILSAEGQAVIEENGYISSVDGAQPFAGSSVAGKVVVAGSSSVTPVMEKLKEAYAAVNPNAEIEVQQSDSSTGINMAIDGSCDIGMASRELKDSELEKDVTPDGHRHGRHRGHRQQRQPRYGLDDRPGPRDLRRRNHELGGSPVTRPGGENWNETDEWNRAGTARGT